MFETEKPFLMPLPPDLCDVSMRLYRKVEKDCTISVEGSRYEVPHTLVGKKIIVRLKDGVLRVFDGDAACGNAYSVAGQRVNWCSFPGLREAILADREMNARKYDRRREGQGQSHHEPHARQICRRCPEPAPVGLRIR